MGTYVSRHQGLLGTVVEISLDAASEDAALDIEAALIGEIARLQAVFDLFDRDSEIRRWQRGEARAGPELREVLKLGLHWQSLSGGAFNPAIGVLLDAWSRAASSGTAPTDRELADLAASIGCPAYSLEPGAAGDETTLRGVNLNAIAKGWIADRAVASVVDRSEIEGLTLNAGGDVRRANGPPILVGIEDPHRPYDNAPPLVRVSLARGAIATSGASRRGWRVGDVWYGHVLDPRTGLPAKGVASASALSDRAATADAVATTLAVLAPAEGMDFVEALGGIGCCIVASDGRVYRNRDWLDREVI